MVSECHASKNVPVQGQHQYEQRSDHICALPEACAWAMDIPMVANRMDEKGGVRKTNKSAIGANRPANRPSPHGP